jgi:hypothetical protein
MTNEKIKPYDYRSAIRNVIDQLPDSKQGLKIGIVSIQGILDMAKIAIAEPAPTEIKKIEIPHESNVNTKTEPKKKNEKPEFLQVERLISGFDLYDPKNPENQLNYHYDEITARRLSVENHDIVKVDYQNTMQRNIPYIVEIVKSVNDPTYFTLLKYCKIEKDNHGQLIVKETYNHQSLKSMNRVFDYYLIPKTMIAKLFIKEDQLIDIGWYNDEPERIIVSLVHYEDELTLPKKEKPKQISNQNSQVSKKETEPETVSTLKFNLQGKHVGIVVGDELRSAPIKKLIQEHHGRLTMIDAFKHSDSAGFYDKQLRKKFDIIVMVQNQNKHNTSKALNKATKKYHLNMAISDGLGIQQIERAIYRALNKYPAYESSANIDYPML